jgi:electron transport complex protein RnfG
MSDQLPDSEPTAHEHSVRFNPKLLLRSTLLLGGITAVASLLLYSVYVMSAPILAQHQQEALLRQLNSLVPADQYNNALAEDTLTVTAPELDLKTPVTIYRARQDNQAVASLLVVTAPNGYSGEIKLMVAVRADGRLAGVRVLAHKETPGLGDYIEDKRSPWVHQFVDKSLTDPSLSRWKVKKDGGIFTYNTGATITPRAIVSTVARTLTWVNENRERLYAP